jgi:AhpD family alkylhydroperoxidase
MLPRALRVRLFETLSLKTMRYVHAVPRRKATGLLAQVYDMIEEDFFINGSLTSRSKVPALIAAIWTAGRESILVDDRLDRTTKEAMNAVLSQVNDCPYCGDMLISLVHAGGQHEAASNIFAENEAAIADGTLRTRLAWASRLRPQVKESTRPRHSAPRNCRKPSPP